LPIAEMTGEEEVEPLAEDVLPKRRCVVLGMRSS
jgi:hypothetical protein